MGLQSKALFWTLMGGSSTVATSTAVSMLSAEQQGLALDFTDSFFFSRYGIYGSACVKDLTTIANNYNSIPGDLLTYTGTTKMTRQSDGVYRYAPHNLYVNSATPANQSITVVSGASYSVTITGSVSVTASGAATGTWTAGTTTFTAATATLTLGSTSGSGTVHVRRTPSDSTYLATVASAKYGLPYEWGVNLTDGTNNTQTVTVRATTSAYNKTTYLVSYDGAGSVALSGGTTGAVTSGAPFYFTSSTTSLVLTVTGSISNLQVREFLGILVEPQATNLFLNNTTGATQTITVSNATAYTVSFFGTGSITFSGANSSTLNGTGATDRVSTTFTTSSTSLTCTVSGSITDVQVETGSVATSVIRTYAASATRAADNISLLPSAIPSAVSAGTLWSDALSFQPITTTQVYCTLSFYGAAGADRLAIYEYNNNIGGFIQTSSVLQADVNDGTGLTASRQRVKWAMAYATNDVAMVHDGGSVYTDATATIPSAFTKVGIGNLGDGVLYIWTGYIKRLLFVPRRMTNTELQTVTT